MTTDTILEVTEDETHYLLTLSLGGMPLDKAYGMIPVAGDPIAFNCYDGVMIQALHIRGELIFSLTDEEMKEQAKGYKKENAVRMKAIEKAMKAMERRDAKIIEFAVENGKIFDNVKHMTWFVVAVADQFYYTKKG